MDTDSGNVTLRVSPFLAGGAYWSFIDQGGSELFISDDIVDVLRERRIPTVLDEQWLHDYALSSGVAGLENTPYVGIGKVPAGATATFRSPGRQPAIAHFAVNSHKQPPTDTEVIDHYKLIFDQTVDELATDHVVSATLSGGLDSSFLVASLASNERLDAPIHAICRSPHPKAVPIGRKGLIHDEYELAQALSEKYRGRVQIHRIFPTPGANPLDASLESSHESWLPTTNPGNMTWIPAVGKLSRELGSTQLMIGSHGNYSFSSPHPYASSYYAARGRLVRAWWCSGQQGARGLRGHMARIASVPKQQVTTQFRAPRPFRDQWRSAGLTTKNPHARKALTHKEFLRRLSPGLTGGTMSVRTWGIPTVDPFAAPRLLELAASMTPAQWCLGPGHRGFARLAGTGRVPDAIRHQRRRGLQGADQWYLMHTMKDRYYDELSLIPDTPVVRELVEADVLRSTLDSLPWGEPGYDQLTPINAVNRILTLAGFIRMSQKRLAEMKPGA